ncbi:SHOCT domain-containing protein [Pseudoxanthomonas suwonensis]|uniref:SHOCT domain-containing protein n=1 Tax=Pseudoxanthomonas suwonensis TaxID=314722 RepID=A0A0E3Z0I2_9GAMM|nr:SHOCT domain-containing protein [Pseudoxanthomonas suwonensis]AKC86573.1 hypothetical protein WQ53_07120 [Pseudoxanthomonas suwonensis]
MRRTRSLLGTAARTAVITGTAKAVLGKGNPQAPAPEAPAVPAPAAAPAPGMTEDRIAMLQKLGELQKSGVLTEEEFAAEKAKILSA